MPRGIAVRRICGIDPGVSGAVAFDTPDGPSLKSLPYIGSRLDTELMDTWFIGVDFAYVEEPQTLHGQGNMKATKTTFTNFGILIEFLRVHGVGLIIVRPAVWKKALGIVAPPKSSSKARKILSINRARLLYPTVDLRRTERCTVYHDGFAEALLLMHYGRQLCR